MGREFADIFGVAPRAYQLQVAQLLLSGQNVVLRAPTGYGKTFTALFPFLYALRTALPFPRQLLYSLPLRVLANSLAATSTPVAAPAIVRLQTGESSDDRQLLHGDLIFATYDQILSSFLQFPFSLGQRQANVNAGAVISSYLVFDEIHLMEVERSLGTTVEMLQWIRCTTPFLLMTATLTDDAVHWLCRKTGAVLVQLSDSELAELPKPRRWRWTGEPISGDRICRHHSGKTIVVVNQVERAQELYLDLMRRKHVDNDVCLADTRLLLLHSRFITKHRRIKSKLIERWFGKHSRPSRCILIATQVIEVGLDITCTDLHTELAPASSLVQRAGRCARFDGQGTVRVYELPDEPGRAHLPYSKLLCDTTRHELQAAYPADDAAHVNVGYADELAFVNRVHGADDLAALTRFEADARAVHIREAMLSARGADFYRDLVRNVDSTSVIVCPDPQRAAIRPFHMESFSIRPGTLAKVLHEAQHHDRPIIWLPSEHVPNGLEEDEQGQRIMYDWVPVTSPDQLLSAYQLAISPKVAAYDSQLGLRLNTAGNWESQLTSIAGLLKEDYAYSRETYEEHIRKVYRSYDRNFCRKDRLRFAIRRLETAFDLAIGDLEQLLLLVIACHDVAKLTIDWQSAINAFQNRIGARPAGPGEFLAHSDMNPSDPRHKQANRTYKRPPHAAESAMFSARAAFHVYESRISAETESLLKMAFVAAIATHHSPMNRSCSSQRLAPGATAEIARVVGLICGAPAPPKFVPALPSSVRELNLEQSKILPNPHSNREDTAFLLYLLLVRALRIADQHSFEEA